MKSIILLFVLMSFVSQGCMFSKSVRAKRNTYSVHKSNNNDTGALFSCLVLDKTYGTPIEDAIILVRGTKIYGETNSKGSVCLNLKPGNYSLSLINFSNRINTKRIKVRKGKNTIVKFNVYVSSIICRE